MKHSAAPLVLTGRWLALGPVTPTTRARPSVPSSTRTHATLARLLALLVAGPLAVGVSWLATGQFMPALQWAAVYTVAFAVIECVPPPRGM